MANQSSLNGSKDQNVLKSVTYDDIILIMKRMNLHSYLRLRKACKFADAFAEENMTRPVFPIPEYNLTISNMIDNRKNLKMLIEKNGHYSRYDLKTLQMHEFIPSEVSILFHQVEGESDKNQLNEAITTITAFLKEHRWTKVPLTVPGHLIKIPETLNTPIIYVDGHKSVNYDEIMNIPEVRRKVIKPVKKYIEQYQNYRLQLLDYTLCHVLSYADEKKATQLLTFISDTNDYVLEFMQIIQGHIVTQVIISDCREGELYVKLWNVSLKDGERAVTVCTYVIHKKRLTRYTRFYAREMIVDAATIAHHVDTYSATDKVLV